MDEIMMKLGELIAERRHRKEEQTSVEVVIPSRFLPHHYHLRWKTGNTLMVLHCDETGANNKVATFYIEEFCGFNRQLGVAIKGVIDGVELLLEQRRR